MKKRLISFFLVLLLLLPILTAMPLGTFAANTNSEEPDWFTGSEALRLYEMNRPSNAHVDLTAQNVTLSDGTEVDFDTAVGVSTFDEFESAVTAATGDRRYVYLLDDISKTKTVFEMEVVDDVIIDLAGHTLYLDQEGPAKLITFMEGADCCLIDTGTADYGRLLFGCARDGQTVRIEKGAKLTFDGGIYEPEIGGTANNNDFIYVAGSLKVLSGFFNMMAAPYCYVADADYAEEMVIRGGVFLHRAPLADINAPSNTDFLTHEGNRHVQILGGIFLNREDPFDWLGQQSLPEGYFYTVFDKAGNLLSASSNVEKAPTAMVRVLGPGDVHYASVSVEGALLEVYDETSFDAAVRTVNNYKGSGIMNYTIRLTDDILYRRNETRDRLVEIEPGPHVNLTLDLNGHRLDAPGTSGKTQNLGGFFISLEKCNFTLTDSSAEGTGLLRAGDRTAIKAGDDTAITVDGATLQGADGLAIDDDFAADAIITLKRGKFLMYSLKHVTPIRADSSYVNGLEGLGAYVTVNGETTATDALTFFTSRRQGSTGVKAMDNDRVTYIKSSFEAREYDFTVEFAPFSEITSDVPFDTDENGEKAVTFNAIVHNFIAHNTTSSDDVRWYFNFSGPDSAKYEIDEYSTYGTLISGGRTLKPKLTAAAEIWYYLEVNGEVTDRVHVTYTDTTPEAEIRTSVDQSGVLVNDFYRYHPIVIRACYHELRQGEKIETVKFQLCSGQICRGMNIEADAAPNDYTSDVAAFVRFPAAFCDNGEFDINELVPGTYTVRTVMTTTLGRKLISEPAEFDFHLAAGSLQWFTDTDNYYNNAYYIQPGQTVIDDVCAGYFPRFGEGEEITYKVTNIRGNLLEIDDENVIRVVGDSGYAKIEATGTVTNYGGTYTRTQTLYFYGPLRTAEITLEDSVMPGFGQTLNPGGSALYYGTSFDREKYSFVDSWWSTAPMGESTEGTATVGETYYYNLILKPSNLYQLSSTFYQKVDGVRCGCPAPMTSVTFNGEEPYMYYVDDNGTYLNLQDDRLVVCYRYGSVFNPNATEIDRIEVTSPAVTHGMNASEWESAVTYDCTGKDSVIFDCGVSNANLLHTGIIGGDTCTAAYSVTLSDRYVFADTVTWVINGAEHSVTGCASQRALLWSDNVVAEGEPGVLLAPAIEMIPIHLPYGETLNLDDYVTVIGDSDATIYFSDASTLVSNYYYKLDYVNRTISGTKNTARDTFVYVRVGYDEDGDGYADFSFTYLLDVTTYPEGATVPATRSIAIRDADSGRTLRQIAAHVGDEVRIALPERSGYLPILQNGTGTTFDANDGNFTFTVPEGSGNIVFNVRYVAQEDLYFRTQKQADGTLSATMMPECDTWFYSTDGSNWSSDPTFTGLEVGSTLAVYVRSGVHGAICVAAAKLPGATSVPVDGRVIAGGDPEETVTVTLSDPTLGVAVYTTTTDAESGFFAFPVVAPGDYILTASMEGCAPKELALTVADERVSVTVSLWQNEDLNSDGVVDIADVTTLLNALSGNASAMRPGAGDLDSSGAIDIADVTALLNYLSH